MKALLILKGILGNTNFCSDCGGLDYCNNINKNRICGMIFEVDNAIIELESLEQQNTALQARIKELEEYAKSERVAGYRQGADDVYLLLAPKQN